MKYYSGKWGGSKYIYIYIFGNINPCCMPIKIELLSKGVDAEASHDDVLKLDATAEMDEFSKFLNEFEDEVLTDKKEVNYTI